MVSTNIIMVQNNNIEKTFREDKKIIFTIIFQFCMLITNYTAKELFGIDDPAIRSMISFLFMMIVGLLFIKNFFVVFKRIKILFINTYIFFAIIFLLNALLFDKNQKYILYVSFWFFIICLPTALYYISIKDKGLFLSMFIKSGYYQILLGLIYFASSTLRGHGYDMVFSYLILVPIILLIYKIIFLKFKVIDIILVVLGVISILAVGARGPLLPIAIFLIVSVGIYFYENKKKGKTWVFFFITLAAVMLFIINYQALLLALKNLFTKYGIQSRSLWIFINNPDDFSSGRSEIYSIIIQYIYKKPFIGYGLAGDRVLLNGGYPHNIFLEILTQFGIIFGSLIIILLFFYLINGIFLNKNKDERNITIIFMAIGLIGLFYSGSYLTSSIF